MAIDKFVKHIPPYDSEHAYDLIRVQENLEPILDKFTDNPNSDSKIISDISLSTSATIIEHKLGRAWRGWYTIDVASNVRVYRDTSTVVDEKLFIVLRASGSVVVSIIIF